MRARQGERPAQQMPAHVGPANELEQHHEWDSASRHGLPRCGRRRGDRPSAALGDMDIMRDDQYSGTESRVQAANERENFGAGMGIQVAGGLAGQQDRRVNRKRASNGAALPLAARKFIGEMIETRAQAHQPEQFPAPLPDPCPGPPAKMQGERDIL